MYSEVIIFYVIGYVFFSLSNMLVLKLAILTSKTSFSSTILGHKKWKQFCMTDSKNLIFDPLQACKKNR